MDDTTLQAARRGNTNAQAELLRALQDTWFRVSLGMLGDADDARDATQETAVRFLAQLAQFRGDSQLRTWAIGIAINVAREMKRAARPVDGLRLAETVRGLIPPDIEAEISEQHEMLRATLDDLPERQREAIVLRYFEDLSVEDTAGTMQCAVGTVKATIHQALRKLKERMRQLR